MNQSKTKLQTNDTEVLSILNAPGLNKIFSLSQKSVPNRIYPIMQDEAMFDLTDSSLFIENYQVNHTIKIRVFKMLDFLVKCLSDINEYKKNENEKIETVIQFSLDEYACLLGKTKLKNDSTRKNVRRLINEALEIIYSISIESSEKRCGKKVNFKKMRICQMYECKNSIYTFVFTESFARYLLSSYIMRFPMSLFRLDERNTNAYSIGRKLALHQSINNNRKKGTNKIISVKILLQTAPDIPSIETVRAKNGSWTERIEEKLVKSLDLLVENGVLEYWNYCNEKGIELSDEQLNGFGHYFIFENLKIEFSVKGI
ncbi:TPA: hypothetical protein TZY74_000875 [Streptococcus suis]|uniref:Uncharacterized protein n=1 Tax=Streptococcus suis TaxID=1307 RepID=A0A0Z8GUZ5_STRSU|nr:hypothetical protein [Streptococcus suis]MCQ8785869.1 hypothetical protein [Streptococcus suis]NQH41868.1 hypothetical protein [Streptococcus suis]NQH56442.1 hypothetical protein [Streptococcus suis]NQN64041.1 hypothetical protein [Streptococcus suis]NQO52433.1 hypothetical protein [Streptococcus suis]